ncbi:DUF4282 domain-containing protein [Oxalicibacterium faecigallinarum]|nr:DUF4282 domain-containing protein [Oxalicibacterium faecigallinarum]
MTNQISTSLLRYVSLEHLIAPLLIKAIYWAGLIAILSATLGGLLSVDNGVQAAALLGVALPLALLLWRLFCEMLILAFNIYARLTEIRDLLAQRQARIDAHRKPLTVASLRSPRLNPSFKVQHD